MQVKFDFIRSLSNRMNRQRIVDLRDVSRKFIHQIIKGKYPCFDLLEQNSNVRLLVERSTICQRKTAIINQIASPLDVV